MWQAVFGQDSFSETAGSTERLDPACAAHPVNRHCPMQPPPGSIVLIGMMGAGKSSVGRCLQKRTGKQRFDLDELIVAKAGMSIPEMFSQKGEEWFRDLESAVLAELPRDVSTIIVTGGGIVLRPANVELVKRLGTVVWLDAEVETLLERAARRGNRPLLQTKDPHLTISEMMATRQPLYANVSNIRIDTTHLTHDEVTDRILRELQDQGSEGLTA
jgi:shikimate kinase